MHKKTIGLYIIIASIVSMTNSNSMLDKVKTSLAVSMRTKNDLKKLKGSMSYEEYIRYLIRLQSKNDLGLTNKNTIVVAKFNRTEGFISDNEYGIIFCYNKFTDTPNFRFDIELKTIRKNGKQIPLEQYLKERDPFKDYFIILEYIIRKEIEPMFSFQKYGRADYTDYESWKKHFEILGLSKTSFEEDVMEKLSNYQRGENPYA